jgi:hypothetical protein
MPYPESCPECGGAFRNTGTHFTARRNEIGRHVLLELGCQNTSGRFWWDFTTGSLTEDGRPSPVRRAIPPATLAAASATNGVYHADANGRLGEVDGHVAEAVGHAGLSTLESPPPTGAEPVSVPNATRAFDVEVIATTEADRADTSDASAQATANTCQPVITQEETQITEVVELAGSRPVAEAPIKDAFVRQLQLDRLTLRQMRSWLMSDEARRAIEVAAGATEATYERLALILFGVDLPQLLGKQAAVPASTGMSAEERLELQREKARIRARLRRAAAKSARQST